MNINDSLPIFSISTVAKLTGITPRMLREYENHGFIRPHRIKNRRLFSHNDIKFLEEIKFYLKEKKMSIAGLGEFYLKASCWEIKRCHMPNCPAYGNYKRMCWEIIKPHKKCDSSLCCSCPIYLIKIIDKVKDIKGPLSPTAFKNKPKPFSG